MFSIIMPAYNASQYIDLAIQSIVEQTYQYWELIVIDDGSNDDTKQKVNIWVEKDIRIKLICQPNSGQPSIARNNGLKHASGELVCFLDADDTIASRKLEMSAEMLEKHQDIDILFTDFSTIDENGSTIQKAYLDNKSFLIEAINYITPIDNMYICSKQFYKFMALKSTAIHTITIVIRHNAIKELKMPFATDLTIGEDLDLWFRLLLNNEAIYLPTALSNYRINPHSITKNDKKLLEGTLQTHLLNFQRYKNHLTHKEKMQYKRKVAVYAENLAYYCRTNNELKASLKYYKLSLAINLNLTGFYNLLKASCFYLLNRQ